MITDSTLKKKEMLSPTIFSIVGDDSNQTESQQERTPEFTDSVLKAFAESTHDVIWFAKLSNLDQLLYINPAIHNHNPFLDEIPACLNFRTKNIHPEDLMVVRQMANSETGMKTGAIEYRIASSSGEWKWVREKIQIIKMENFSCMVAMGIISEIIQIKGEHLLTIDNRHNEGKRWAGEIICQLETDCTGALSSFHLPDSNSSSFFHPKPGQKIWAIMDEPEAAEFYSNVFKNLDNRNAPSLLHKEFISKNGQWIAIKINHIYNTTGDFTGISSSITDIVFTREKEEKIILALEEKEVLLREIHHRVKNNFQVIGSLLLLHSQKPQAGEAAEILENCYQRIRAMSMVHEQLYLKNNLEKISLREYILELIENLETTQIIIPGKIIVEKNLEEISVNINNAIPLGLITQEILANSIKYAFPGRRKGKISVMLKRINEKGILLEIRDNGIGMNPQTELPGINSIGLHLVDALIGQLHGTIQTYNDGGLVNRIILP